MKNKTVCTLGDIADIQTGPFGSQLHVTDYVENGIPVIMPTNIGNNLNVNVDKIAKISEITFAKLSKYGLQENDIVYSRRGDVEKCAFISNKKRWLCGTGCLRVRVNKANMLPKFIAYQLSTNEVKDWVSGHAVGSTMPNLNSTILAHIPLINPTLSEQHAIASVLSSLDDKIDLLHRQNKTLEAMAEALFRQRFVVEKKEEWEEKKLSEEFYIYIGRTPSRKNLQSFSFTAGNTWISIKDMGQNGIYISDSSEYLVDEAVEKCKLPIIPKNTVILSFKMTIGRVKITTIECFSNEAIASFIPHKKSIIYPEFLYLFLKQFNFDELGSTSSIVTSINTEIIKNITLFIPPAKLLQRFSTIIQPFFNKISMNQNQIRTLEKLRDTLLPKLMSGEVRVKY